MGRGNCICILKSDVFYDSEYNNTYLENKVNKKQKKEKKKHKPTRNSEETPEEIRKSHRGQITPMVGHHFPGPNSIHHYHLEI